MTKHILGIRFHRTGKIYHFDASGHTGVAVGDFVVVETSRGQQIGEVIQIVDETQVQHNGRLKPIMRRATPRDLVLRQVWQFKEKEAIETCTAKKRELGLDEVKIVDAEYTFDGKRLTILYSSERDEQIDLFRLRKAMKRHYPRTRVDFRQIGSRDVAKLIGGMGACGMDNRCCSRFLMDFKPISIRMAKDQGVSLAPSEITGMCGRLRCCLVYEHEQYVEARKLLPREKKRITTPMGEGKVISVSPLIRRILVDLGDAGLKEFSLEELEGTDEPPPQPDEAPPKTEQKKPPPRRPSRRSSRRKRRKRK